MLQFLYLPVHLVAIDDLFTVLLLTICACVGRRKRGERERSQKEGVRQTDRDNERNSASERECVVEWGRRRGRGRDPTNENV